MFFFQKHYFAEKCLSQFVLWIQFSKQNNAQRSGKTGGFPFFHVKVVFSEIFILIICSHSVRQQLWIVLDEWWKIFAANQRRQWPVIRFPLLPMKFAHLNFCKMWIVFQPWPFHKIYRMKHPYFPSNLFVMLWTWHHCHLLGATSSRSCGTCMEWICWCSSHQQVDASPLCDSSQLLR